MVLAWAVLLPLGVLSARFFKVLPRQNWPHSLDAKLWWHAHRGLQYAGVFLMLCGIFLVWGHASQTTLAAQIHAVLGWGVVALGVLQILGGLVRGSKGGPTDVTLRGDHYDMSRHRVLFEHLHKSMGYLALCLSVFVILFGLIVAAAPRWMFITIAVWWVVLGFIFMRLQRQNRCFDTYQAIWGPDLAHPGNQMPSVGWGMKRFTTKTFAMTFGKMSKKD